MRVRMVVAYDGAPFAGFAANPGVTTVAGTLTDALARVLRCPIELVGAGRTDAGVHAWGQVVSFDAPDAGFDPARLQRSLNGLCGPHIVVRSVEAAPPDFHARFSARSRTYRYRVLNSAVPNPFVRATTWHVPQPLVLAAMRNAAAAFVGEHDFTSFCKAPDRPEASLVRQVRRAEWWPDRDDVLVFEIEAQSFCHRMVRSIVGTLVDIGRGRKQAADVVAMLAALDHSGLERAAPAHGLTLWSVGYRAADDH